MHPAVLAFKDGIEATKGGIGPQGRYFAHKRLAELLAGVALEVDIETAIQLWRRSPLGWGEISFTAKRLAESNTDLALQLLEAAKAASPDKTASQVLVRFRVLTDLAPSTHPSVLEIVHEIASFEVALPQYELVECVRKLATLGWTEHVDAVLTAMVARANQFKRGDLENLKKSTSTAPQSTKKLILALQRRMNAHERRVEQEKRRSAIARMQADFFEWSHSLPPTDIFLGLTPEEDGAGRMQVGGGCFDWDLSGLDRIRTLDLLLCNLIAFGQIARGDLVAIEDYVLESFRDSTVRLHPSWSYDPCDGGLVEVIAATWLQLESEDFGDEVPGLGGVWTVYTVEVADLQRVHEGACAVIDHLQQLMREHVLPRLARAEL